MSASIPDFASMDPATLAAEATRMWHLLNSPETESFLKGVRLEVAHQIDRWGTVHDRAKEPPDWYWLLGHLGSKAVFAHMHGDRDKALHHTISSAAVLANWHTHILLGSGRFTPGSSDLQQFLADTFGSAID